MKLASMSVDWKNMEKKKLGNFGKIFLFFVFN